MSKVSKSKTVKKIAKPAAKKEIPVVHKTPAPSAPTQVSSAPLKPSAPPVAKATKDERHRMVAEAAYYISIRKGPTGDPKGNWIEAEQQIDAQLKREGRM
ncbi:MAG: DUF2934 domain-containing protein [Verrucomicrobia bacterium]|nr:DUF2934 domain-containing protein [Verrucomicrobiota bacterium]